MPAYFAIDVVDHLGDGPLHDIGEFRIRRDDLAARRGRRGLEQFQEMMGGMLAFMCDDLQSVMNSLKAKNVGCTEVQKQPFGYFTTLQLPSGGRMGLYQPTHQTPLGIGSMENFGALGFKTPAR